MMTDLTPNEIAQKRVTDGFTRSGPLAQSLSDPLVDTPLVVTLDELRPYELNPRLTRNPLYDEIKASIGQRGLDSPPPITKRPGSEHYIIRNGGNTRLAILRELWSETKDEQFFRIPCLFRPWPQRGEIVALTGHLAENELHGGLTFIERALGIEKARELYEQENDGALTQSELARRLASDGYPVPQPHISRMQDTVRYLLPAIPNILYGGLGRHQAERLSVLRKAAELIWEQHAQHKGVRENFEALFHDVLTSFDGHPDAFNIKRLQDELVGQMAHLLDADYNSLELDIDNIERRQRAVTSPPQTSLRTEVPNTSLSNRSSLPTSAPAAPPIATMAPEQSPEHEPPRDRPRTTVVTDNDLSPPAGQTPPQVDPEHEYDSATQAQLHAHIVSPAASTERLEAIQQLVADHTGEERPDFADNALRAIPVQAGGLFPITDVWYIEPSLDTPNRLRVHLGQFAREIAEEAQILDYVETVDTGVGFICQIDNDSQRIASPFSLATLVLLGALSTQASQSSDPPLNIRLEEALGPLLQGGGGLTPDHAISRLSDSGLVKLFRMLRLARRLQDIETGIAAQTGN